MYIAKKKHIIIDYVYYNRKIFNDFLPHPKDLKIGFRPPYKNIIAEVEYNKSKKTIGLYFRYRKFSSRKVYIHVLIHEMVHIADLLEHGILTGHGKHFFKHKKRLQHLGNIPLNLEYKI